MKLIPFRQVKNGSCGYYTLANLFNDSKYLDMISPDRPGMTPTDENEILRACLPDYRISPLAVRIEEIGSLMPRDLRIIQTITTDTPGRANLMWLTVRTVHGSRLHRVGLVSFKDSEGYHYYLVDSLKDSIITFTDCMELRMLYAGVYEVYHIESLVNNRWKWITVDRAGLSHII